MTSNLDKLIHSKVKHLEGVIFDFDGVMTDNSVYVSDTGAEMVRCSRFDGLGLSKLRSIGIAMTVISTEVNPVVPERCKKLRIDCFHGVEDKVAVAVKWAKSHNIDLANVLYLANDINDIPLLENCGIRCGVSDCHKDIKPYLDIVTETVGGYGAVREICDLVFNIKQSAAS